AKQSTSRVENRSRVVVDEIGIRYEAVFAIPCDSAIVGRPLLHRAAAVEKRFVRVVPRDEIRDEVRRAVGAKETTRPGVVRIRHGHPAPGSLVPTDEVKTLVPGTLVGHGQEEMRLSKCADGDRWHVAQLVAGIPDFAGRVSETTVDRRLQTFALGGVERTGRDVEAKVIEVVARPRTLFDVIHGMTSPPFIPVHEADVQPAAVWTRTHARIGTGPAVCVVIFTWGLGEVDQAPCRGPRIPSVRARAIRPEAEVAEREVKEDERVVVSADEGGIADRARDAGPFDPVVDRPRLAGDEMRPRREMTSIQDVEVVGVIDPEDGRQMMIVGGRIL